MHLKGSDQLVMLLQSRVSGDGSVVARKFRVCKAAVQQDGQSGDLVAASVANLNEHVVARPAPCPCHHGTSSSQDGRGFGREGMRVHERCQVEGMLVIRSASRRRSVKVVLVQLGVASRDVLHCTCIEALEHLLPP